MEETGSEGQARPAMKRYETLAQGLAADIRTGRLAPGPMFSARRAYLSCVRLNCGHPWGPPLEDAVQRLGALVREMAAAG